MCHRMQCSIDADPVPALSWFHKGQELQSTGRITIDTQKRSTSLTIVDVCLDDAGDYVCIAKNLVGESSVQTVLRVRRTYHVC